MNEETGAPQGATARAEAGGPLRGLRVVEFAGIGPAPFACMLLADMGADVLCIDRPGAAGDSGNVVRRGRRLEAGSMRQALSMAGASCGFT